MATDPARRKLDDRELTQLQETGSVKTLGGFTLGSIIASLNEVGIGPEDVEVCGVYNRGCAIELIVIDPAEGGSDHVE